MLPISLKSSSRISLLVLNHLKISSLVIEFTCFKICSMFFIGSEEDTILFKTDLFIDQSLLSSPLHLQQVQVSG